MRGRLLMVVGVLLVPALSGCLDPFRPTVPTSLVEGSDHFWAITKGDQEDGGLFGPNIIQTEYRFDGGSDGPPYPGVLLLLGIRAGSRLDIDELLDRTHDMVDETLAEEGVTVEGSEVTGERTLANGAATKWFRIVGVSETDSPLFASSEEVRVLGEAWYDGESSTHVIAVALAQTTGTGFLGSEQRHHAVWDELIGDPEGRIGGATHENGFIFHTRSHG